MTIQIFNLLIVALLLMSGLWVVINTNQREAEDVLSDLRDEKLEINDSILDGTKGSSPTKKKREANRIKKNVVNISGFIFNDDLARAGLIDPKARKSFELWNKFLPLIGGLLFLLPSLFGSVKNPATVFLLVSIGLGFGLVARRYILKTKKEQYLRSLVFYLPMVMERIVMAVQAGLDIIPAINTIITVSEEDEVKKPQDPVGLLLQIALRLTETGFSFEKSLKELALVVDSSAIRHAFLHLAVAQKEGGVLIMPLRELSDSTQLYYQESVEGEIAEMPVKATMPLLCTFAGLLICFLTPPFLQVLSILTENLPTN